MDLVEYQGKQYFARYGIAVSPGEVADTVADAEAVAERLGYPVVVKAQVQVGGRGKAGGIKLADSVAEVREHAGNILGMDIKGHKVRRLWIEKATDIAAEYYASFTLDRSAKLHLAMVSARGGIDIEQVAVRGPGRHRPPARQPSRRREHRGDAASWSPAPGSTRRPARVPPRSSSSSTTATSKATPTSWRSTRSCSRPTGSYAPSTPR